jgi:transcriptional regulator with XRE-family HTH domain
MSQDDQMKLLINLAKELPQAEIARRIGKSPSTINQILKGTYPDPRIILQLIEEKFGSTIIDCPVHGDIPLGQCAEERRKPFSTSRVSTWQACRDCEKGGKS